jgi:hypothetical protein
VGVAFEGVDCVEDSGDTDESVVDGDDAAAEERS